MRVCVIGTRNQAARLISVLLKSKIPTEVFAFHPSKQTKNCPVDVTSDFEKVKSADSVFIASPNSTHIGYLKKLQNFQGYVFVEKPLVSTRADQLIFDALPKTFRQRVYVNYNFVHSPVYLKIEQTLQNKALGKIISARVESCHGLALKPGYETNWRSRSKAGIGEIVGVHFLHMFISLFSELEFQKIHMKKLRFSDRSKSPDTISITTLNECDPELSIFCSYATAFKFLIEVKGTEGHLEYDGEELKIFKPRETYDLEGRFCRPQQSVLLKITHSENWKQSSTCSVDSFLYTASSNLVFNDQNLEKAIQAMHPFFQHDD